VIRVIRIIRVKTLHSITGKDSRTAKRYRYGRHPERKPGTSHIRPDHTTKFAPSTIFERSLAVLRGWGWQCMARRRLTLQRDQLEPTLHFRRDAIPMVKTSADRGDIRRA
jgi:hypothetical protein